MSKVPRWALYALIVGLAVHNLAMALLWRAGVHGGVLTLVSAWKDVLLLGALVVVAAQARDARPRVLVVDLLALAFAGFVVLYAAIPQAWLGGGASAKGIAYAARHDLLPVGGYFLGRGVRVASGERDRLCRVVLWTAAGVAAFGLVDVYLVPLSWWRGVHGWYSGQLGLHYFGLSGLPENFVYNAGNGVAFRRLTSTFLSPLATAYLLVVALFLIPLRRPLGYALAALIFAAVLWTHTRAALIALVAGLIVLAIVRRSWRHVAFAAIVVVVGFTFVSGYDHFAPRTHFTKTELREQEHNAVQHPDASHDATAANEASTSEHLSSLRQGALTVLRHPWGYGLGNAGVTAERTSVRPKAGESTYTELGVETGLLGALCFIAWTFAILWRLLRRVPWLAAAFVAVLVIGIQTDVIGVPWVAVVVWALAGAWMDDPVSVDDPGADGVAAGTPSARTGFRARPT